MRFLRKFLLFFKKINGVSGTRSNFKCQTCSHNLINDNHFKQTIDDFLEQRGELKTLESINIGHVEGQLLICANLKCFGNPFNHTYNNTYYRDFIPSPGFPLNGEEFFKHE